MGFESDTRMSKARTSLSILHILPHCGGGVGSVLRALFAAQKQASENIEISLLSLEELNEHTKQALNALGIPWMESAVVEEVSNDAHHWIRQADIVVVHWWNHPQLMKLLYLGIPSCRLLIWSHVNGLSVPQAFYPEVFEVADLFIFASAASFSSDVVKALSENNANKLRHIQSSAGIPSVVTRPPSRNEFDYGYIGTVEPAKMHAHFLEICSEAKIPYPCHVVGGPAHEQLRRDSEQKKLAHNFVCYGPMNDPWRNLPQLKVFAYPLNPSHYGTGEQVLIEAMAHGAVPVVLSNPPETHIIQNRVTGLVADSCGEFSLALKELFENTNLRMELAGNAESFVANNCNIAVSVSKFSNVFEEAMALPKSVHRINTPEIDGATTGSPFYLFLLSCGSHKDRSLFMGALDRGDPLPCGFVASTRGTPRHYRSKLGPDPQLDILSKSLK